MNKKTKAMTASLILITLLILAFFFLHEKRSPQDLNALLDEMVEKTPMPKD